MSATVDTVGQKKVLVLASNPSVSEQTGWDIGFWWSELTHAYWEFVEAGYQVTIASPDGGALRADPWSDPRDESEYSAEDLLSLGFLNSPEHLALVQHTPAIADLATDEFDAIYLVGGQAPMYTFVNDKRVHELVAHFYESGRIAAVVCHATAILLRTTLSDGSLLVSGKTWTGFANSEEDYADEFVGRRIQPFRIEDEAHNLPGTNFIVQSRFRAHAVRDGLLITGQQQYSGRAAANLLIDALGH
ncbi:type 1 glutamine amidotransferase domain-containing protein [Nocardia sp. NPDC052566]|uniref:type 1 glutamine amidotransferase domain-containing protein n=1 Tax=Nocardia sp. NPDC052566 TaxID=3364330 RepID=UPI0037C57321